MILLKLYREGDYLNCFQTLLVLLAEGGLD